MTKILEKKKAKAKKYYRANGYRLAMVPPGVLKNIWDLVCIDGVDIVFVQIFANKDRLGRMERFQLPQGCRKECVYYALNETGVIPGNRILYPG